MIHAVSAPAFEGPLGLLLELAEKGKVELTAISVSRITADYLARVNALSHLEVEELSEFLRLGSRLLYIKSLSLLPREAAQQDIELKRLSLELAEYRRYQQAARKLSGMLGTETWQRSAVTKLSAQDLPLPRLQLSLLQEAFGRALKRAAPQSATISPHQELSQAEVMGQLRKRLASGSFDLQTVLEEATDRFEIIITFLALLELLKSGQAAVVQADQFGSILIEATHA